MRVLTSAAQVNKEIIRLIRECTSCQVAVAWGSVGFEAFDVLAKDSQKIAMMVVGTHFFSPAHVMRLVEIVRGARTSNEVIATALALAKQLRKVGVVVGNCRGFVGNRMMLPYMREAHFLVEEGATPAQVDRALLDFGMAMGIFAVEDMGGIDLS